MTVIDPGRPEVIEFELRDRALLTLEALADAAERLPADHSQHHVARLGRLLPDGRVDRLEHSTPEVIRTIRSNDS